MTQQQHNRAGEVTPKDILGRYDYAKASWRYRQHHMRFKARVEAQRPRLYCQECGGSGGETVPLCDDGSGPFEDCGFCEGTGLTTPWERGWWLRWKREEKRMKKAA